ncbi:unnamed protein product [Protopolystoma xenopodis]|uniref:Uncharacterized protein n=1 Tax=Protopolystoma xenopodis TaxID=117903 RepID=A0A448XE25_9PLAT|nr:unnamed protein product [Protopolystoma xenopodis]
MSIKQLYGRQSLAEVSRRRDSTSRPPGNGSSTDRDSSRRGRPHAAGVSSSASAGSTTCSRRLATVRQKQAASRLSSAGVSRRPGRHRGRQRRTSTVSVSPSLSPSSASASSASSTTTVATSTGVGSADNGSQTAPTGLEPAAVSAPGQAGLRLPRRHRSRRRTAKTSLSRARKVSRLVAWHGVSISTRQLLVGDSDLACQGKGGARQDRFMVGITWNVRNNFMIIQLLIGVDMFGVETAFSKVYGMPDVTNTFWGSVSTAMKTKGLIATL